MNPEQERSRAGLALDAAELAVAAATFEKTDLLISPALLLKKFGNATIPMAAQIHMLQRQFQSLRRTRDLLLLLNGEVSVAQAEEVAHA